MGWTRKISYLSGGFIVGQHFRSKDEQTARNTRRSAKQLKKQTKLMAEQAKLSRS